MIKSIFYKEWIKSRWVLLVIAGVFTSVLAYSFMNISNNFRVSGVNEYWELIVQKGISSMGYIKYLPLLSGTLLAIAQFVPEITNKRLKLTLHLPMAESKMILFMLGFGIICLSMLFSITYLTTTIGMNLYFCKEIACWNLSEIYPWLCGGIASYLLSVWICLEPVWKQRVLKGFPGLCAIALFYFDEMPGAYAPFIGYLIAFVVLSLAFVFHSLVRFKDGEQ